MLIYVVLLSLPQVLPFMPMLLVGINIGVLLNTILPAWLITILLVILIAYLTVQSTGKGLQQRRKEAAAFARQAQVPARAAS